MRCGATCCSGRLIVQQKGACGRPGAGRRWKPQRGRAAVDGRQRAGALAGAAGRAPAGATERVRAGGGRMRGRYPEQGGGAPLRPDVRRRCSDKKCRTAEGVLPGGGCMQLNSRRLASLWH